MGVFLYIKNCRCICDVFLNIAYIGINVEHFFRVMKMDLFLKVPYEFILYTLCDVVFYGVH